MHEKEIGGHTWRWRIPHENDLDAISERQRLIEQFPGSPLVPCWRNEIEYLEWINCWN